MSDAKHLIGLFCAGSQPVSQNLFTNLLANHIMNF